VDSERVDLHGVGRARAVVEEGEAELVAGLSFQPSVIDGLILEVEVAHRHLTERGTGRRRTGDARLEVCVELQEHLAEEEEMLFPLLRSVLDQRQLFELAERVQEAGHRVPAPI
jgi:hypothetical protein